HFIIDQHRHPDFWRRNEQWAWEISPHLAQCLAQSGEAHQALSHVSPYQDFELTQPGRSTDHPQQYILIGKGRP
ncbi:MAG TPA: hypothetical protein PLQ67_09320, partial [Burkholderiaceae bacterium]|nr:hypothetical protein [Burkholderiaceae bacterium]